MNQDTTHQFNQQQPNSEQSTDGTLPLILAPNNHPELKNGKSVSDLARTLNVRERKNKLPMKRFSKGELVLAEGTMEKFALAAREEVCISTIFALIHCYERYMYFTELYASKEELKKFKQIGVQAESTIDVNKNIAVIVPMLTRRIYELNKLTKCVKRKIKIYEIGDYIALAEPWELTISDAGIYADLNYYTDHRAKICENGQIVFTHLTCPDGTVVSGIANHQVPNSQGGVSQPFLEGVPYDPVGNVWEYIKPVTPH